MQPEMITKATTAIKQLVEIKRKYKLELDAFVEENKELEVFSTFTFLRETKDLSKEELDHAKRVAQIAIDKILALPFEIDRLEVDLRTLKSVD